MGRKSLASFIDRLRNDREFQSAFTEFASQHGFALDADELGDADLDNVAGGIDTVPLPTARLHVVKKKAAVKKKAVKKAKKVAKKKSTR